jgi:hypothetical protein
VSTGTELKSETFSTPHRTRRPRSDAGISLRSAPKERLTRLLITNGRRQGHSRNFSSPSHVGTVEANRDSLDFPMPVTEVRRTATSAGCALVTVVPTLRWSPLPHQCHLRTDPSFVTQLIATAELIPQTCALRRATSTAYRSTASRNQETLTGTRMRQIA